MQKKVFALSILDPKLLVVISVADPDPNLLVGSGSAPIRIDWIEVCSKFLFACDKRLTKLFVQRLEDWLIV